MAFRFNFLGSENSDSLANKSDIQDKSLCKCSECKFIYFDGFNTKTYESTVDYNKGKCIKSGEFEINYITQEHLRNDISLKIVNKPESDLLPGEYEGGLKVWECSFDLIHFLVERKCIQQNTSVLELGCGVGLPGILCYMKGANVTFQDYNSEILELITAPNVILNTPDDKRQNAFERCHYLCGDWGDIQEKFYSNGAKKELFDVIISSETIYNKFAQTKLLNLMKSALKPDGVIYLASKVHYFGVGGGIADFEDILIADNSFVFTTVFQSKNGVERRILELTFKKH